MECSGSAPYLSDHGGAGVAHRVARIGHHATADRSGRVAARRDGPGSAYRTARFVRVAHHAAGVRVHDPPWSNTYLGVADAHKFATGAGVTVAVIDTGVDASPRVPAEPGGDFVDQAGNGLSDCDAHGTLTASIIAAGPRPPTGSSASRPTLDCSRYVRRLRPSNRSAHKPTRMTPTPPRPPVPSAVLPAPWCTPPTSAWV